MSAGPSETGVGVGGRTASRLVRRSVAVAVTVALASFVWLVGCGSPRLQHVSAAEFVERAQIAGEAHSAQWATFVGATAERAYLEHGTLSNAASSLAGGAPTVVVFWTELDRLPADVADVLRAGETPEAWRSSSRPAETEVSR